jgi:hypothetical protein
MVCCTDSKKKSCFFLVFVFLHPFSCALFFQNSKSNFTKNILYQQIKTMISSIAGGIRNICRYTSYLFGQQAHSLVQKYWQNPFSMRYDGPRRRFMIHCKIKVIFPAERSNQKAANTGPDGRFQIPISSSAAVFPVEELEDRRQYFTELHLGPYTFENGQSMSVRANQIMTDFQDRIDDEYNPFELLRENGSNTTVRQLSTWSENAETFEIVAYRPYGVDDDAPTNDNQNRLARALHLPFHLMNMRRASKTSELPIELKYAEHVQLVSKDVKEDGMCVPLALFEYTKQASKNGTPLDKFQRGDELPRVLLRQRVPTHLALRPLRRRGRRDARGKGRNTSERFCAHAGGFAT